MYSELSYNDELIPIISATNSAESKLLESLKGILPVCHKRASTPNYGVFFVGVQGENMREDDSPSWFNAAEGQEVY